MNTPVIFLIDKNPIHASLVKYHLNMHRFMNVQVFPNGEECLYRLQKGGIPQFLVTEYDIGNYTGFDFLEKVKSIHKGIRVIFFTRHDDPILALRLLESGACDYIAKTGKLETGIRELIKNVKFLTKAESLI